MNGVDPPNGNRFQELLPNVKNRPNKNKRPRSDDFVPLPTVFTSERNMPRYLVATAISFKENEIPRSLAAYNVFQVERGLNRISTCHLQVNEMKSGDLLIKVANHEIAEKFLKAKFIDNIPVKISLHKTLNTVQGRIFSRKIIDIPEKELLSALEDQKVVEIHKVMKREGEKLVATGAAIVTFDLIKRPEKIKLGWELVRVDEFIPNPMRCLNCQKLGHTRKRCRNVEQCRECGSPPPHEQCLRKYCINCQTEEHTSYDPACPTFWKHKSVNYIRISRKCTTREAWTIYNDNPSINSLKPPQLKNKISYAQILKNQHMEHNKTTVTLSKNNNNETPTTSIKTSTVPNTLSFILKNNTITNQHNEQSQSTTTNSKIHDSTTTPINPSSNTTTQSPKAENTSTH